MNDTEYAEAWVRTKYRMQPNEESLVHLLVEYLIIRNERNEQGEMLPWPGWYCPGPPVRKSWKAELREFDEECNSQGIKEQERPRCLRETLKIYRKKWRGQNPDSARALIRYICEYESKEQCQTKYVTGEYSDFIEKGDLP